MQEQRGAHQEKKPECIWNKCIYGRQRAQPQPWKARPASETEDACRRHLFSLFNSNLATLFDHRSLFPQSTYKLAEHMFPNAIWRLRWEAPPALPLPFSLAALPLAQAWTGTEGSMRAPQRKSLCPLGLASTGKVVRGIGGADSCSSQSRRTAF